MTELENVMTRQEAMAALRVSLTEAIQAWMDTQNDDGDAWAEIGFVGDDLGRLMAIAGINVIEASADVQDYLKREGQLTED